MEMTQYIPTFLVSFLLCTAFIVILLHVFRNAYPESVRKEARHQSARSVSRFGGIACIVSSMVLIVVHPYLVLTYSWWGILIISSAILFFGVVDDLREISWQKQLLFQVIIGIIAFIFHIRFTSLHIPFYETMFLDSGRFALGISCILTVLWIIVVMNAINWSDGLDGICGAISCIAFATIFFVSLYPEVNQPPIAIYAITLVGVSLAFLIFNVYPAKIFAGTSGSWFFGFSLAALAIFSGTKVATAILVLIIPLIDAMWVIFERFITGNSLFKADTRHLHHRLQKIGWSTGLIASMYTLVTIVIAYITLHIRAQEKIAFFAALLSLFIFFFYWVHRSSKMIVKV